MQRHELPLLERLVGVVGQAASLASRPASEAACPTRTTASPGSSSENKNDEAIQALLNSLAQIVDSLHTRRQQALGEIAQTSVELGVAIAERLLGAEIAANRQRLDQIVRAALERIPPNRAVVLRAHTDDVTLVKQQIKENAALDRHDELLTFQPDDAFRRGQVKLEAEEMFVEWDTQRCLAELRNVLLEETITEP